MSRLGLIAFYLCIASPAFAYVDPNAGGVVFQLATPLLAFLATSMMVLRRKLSAFRSLILTGFRKLLVARQRAED